MEKLINFKIGKSIVIAFLIVFFAFYKSFSQTTVICPVIADAFIPEKNPAINYGSNTSILIGRESTGEPIETLIMFDFSSIPNCATIVNTELTLNYNGPHDQVSADIYLASNTWDENTVTWNNKPSYSNWYAWFMVPSGDGSGSYQIPLNDPVIAWIENGVPNYGIYIKTDISNTNSGNLCFFHSKEGSGGAPSLEVTYTTGTNSTAPSGISANPSSICSGNSTTLTVIGGSLGTGASWKWYSGSCGGTYVGSGISVSLSPSSTTTYYVRAEGDCNTTSCANVTVTVYNYSSSSAPAGASANPNLICPGNSSTLTVSGGSLGTGASWKWYSGSCGGTYVGSGSSYSVSPSSTTTYYVRAEGTCNTTSCASTTVNVNTASTAPSGISADPASVCSGNSTTLTVTGGSLGAGASWKWYSGSCGGTYIGSGNSVSVSPSSTTTYYLRAEGSCNITSCASTTVNVNISSLSPSGISADPVSVCQGNSTTLTVTGGSLGTGASWKWYADNCGDTYVGSGNSVSVSPDSTTTYYVRAEGDCNTTSCASRTVGVGMLSTAPSGIIADPVYVCSGNSTTLTVTGGSLGTGAYWRWYTGSCGNTYLGTGSSISVSPGSKTDYYVRAEGVCNTTSCTNLVVPVFNLSAFISSSTEPTCRNADGSATVTVTEGTEPYTYLWDDPANTTDSTITGLSAGVNYNVSVTDANNCVDEKSVILYGSDVLYVSVTDSTNISCYGLSDGSATVKRSRGTAPLTYLWDDPGNSTDSIVTGLSANVYYHVKVTDTADCVTYDSVILSEPDLLIADITDSSNISCYGFSDGSATIMSTGGTSPYAYLWDDSKNTTSPTVTELLANQYYHVTVTDAHNCTDKDSVILSEPDILKGNITDSSNISCFGFSDGSVTLTVSGGTFPYTYLWDDPQNTINATVTGLSASQYYHITSTDANNCMFRDSVILSEPALVLPPEAENITACYGYSIPDFTATGANIRWYSDPGLSNLEHSGSAFNSGDTSLNIYTYYTTQTIDNCESLPDTVTLTIKYCVSDSYPYQENFKNGSGGWFAEGINSSWEWGVPDGPTIISVAPDDYAWVTNLTGSHNNNEISFVYSPIFNFNDISEPYISIKIWYDCEYAKDGANLQYSTDAGKTWQILGVYLDGYFENWNWYNRDKIESLSLHFGSNSNLANGWTGDENNEGSRGWIIARHDLPGLGNLSDVRFRFVFGSDESTVNDGFAFDSIRIGSEVIGINPLTSEESELKIYPNPFTDFTTIEFPNSGNDTYKLIVTDLTGKTVRIIDHITGSQVLFNRAELPGGFYLIELRGIRRFIGKILIE